MIFYLRRRSEPASVRTMSQRIQLAAGDHIEIAFPDGSVLRLRWDTIERGIKITAEEHDGHLATALAVLPRDSNGVVLQVG